MWTDRASQRYLAQLKGAAERFTERRQRRADHEKQLVDKGPGAADSDQRRTGLAERNALRVELRSMVERGQIPAARERILGNSFDIIDFAPSESARAAGRPVARLVYRPSADIVPQAVATGFLISPRLLLTNHHVLASAAEAVDIYAEFLYERSELGIRQGRLFALEPNVFFFADAALDFAVVAIRPVNEEKQNLAEFGFIPMIEATPKAAVGEPAMIVQHPAGRSKSYAVSNNRLLDIEETGHHLTYETDTEPGSSGSPVYSKYWELIALHHSAVPRTKDGEYIKRDGTVWNSHSDDVEDIDWIANEGIRCSSIVARMRQITAASPPQQALLDEYFRGTADPMALVGEFERNRAGAVSAAAASAAPGSPPNITINITGTANFSFQFNGISAPATAATPPAAVARPTPQDVGDATPAAPPALEKMQNFDDAYSQRKGYDPTFLGQRIALPRLGKALTAELLKDADGKPLVVPYYHFSLVLHRKRRQCLWTALNVHYGKHMRDERTRDDFGGENWRRDPRLAALGSGDVEIIDAEFYRPAKNVDRGHIVRREDNCWGSTRGEREYANADTYHWSNCSPQHEVFNQETPKGYDEKGVWGWLERELQKEIAAQSDPRALIFAGPVLKADDPAVTVSDQQLQYPRRFWKVVTYRPDAGSNALRTLCFLLDQSAVVDRYGLGIEVIASQLLSYQVSIAEISRETGIQFAAAVVQADDLRNTGGAAAVRKIGTNSDVADVIGSAARGAKPAATRTAQKSAGNTPRRKPAGVAKTAETPKKTRHAAATATAAKSGTAAARASAPAAKKKRQAQA